MANGKTPPVTLNEVKGLGVGLGVNSCQLMVYSGREGCLDSRFRGKDVWRWVD
jgi:hypothetical protein